MTDFDNIPPKFRHPLAEWGQIVETEDGRQEATCNLWATASLWTWQYYEGNPKTESLILECIHAGGECDNPMPLLMNVRLGQDEAIQNCITYVQGGLTQKFDEAFKQ
ncbi:MAG: hypothetical protein ACPGVO_00060 [Spirulinaceae cyanobacterium]